MSTSTQLQITPQSEAPSLASRSSQAQRSLRTKAMSPTTVRKAMEDRSSNDLFSPTSAAALALSSLHQFGAQRDNRAAPPDTELKGTRLFNSDNIAPRVVTQDENDNSNKKNKNEPERVVQTTNNNTTTATFTPSFRHANTPTPPPPPTAYPPPPPPHYYHCDPNQPPQPYQPQAPPPAWRRPPLPIHHHHHHHHQYMARYPYTHAQMDPSFPWDPQQQQQQQQSNAPQSQQPPHSFNRTSPVPSLGGPYQPLAPMPRPPAVLQHPPQIMAPPPTATSAKFARLASCASTLVTPTPKKAKLSHPSLDSSSKNAAANAAHNPDYSRKKKSLGILAENFLNSYKDLAKGSTIVVDEAAIKLGVERRRIYDVVNILESISLVCKKHKNTYTWMGMGHLDAVFCRLQAQAMCEYPQDAQKFLGSCSNDNVGNSENTSSLPALKPARKNLKTSPSSSSSSSRENKSLAKLSQEFLQVFLVGHETLSLPEASDKIQGTTSMEELIAMGRNNNKAASTEKELKAAAARGLKTKIRRLYDIANVFLSVGLLKKVDRGDASRRPNFSWSYTRSAKQLYQLHQGGGELLLLQKQQEEMTTVLATEQPPHPPPPMVQSA